jgi:hypothetical protein
MVSRDSNAVKTCDYENPHCALYGFEVNVWMYGTAVCTGSKPPRPYKCRSLFPRKRKMGVKRKVEILY